MKSDIEKTIERKFEIEKIGKSIISKMMSTSCDQYNSLLEEIREIKKEDIKEIRAFLRKSNVVFSKKFTILINRFNA